MILIPAIDLKDHKVVRLYKGRFDEPTFYPLKPVEAAKKWVMAGAKYLHVVDLDGAQTGSMGNLDSIKEIVKSVKVPVQVGGGVRSEMVIESLLEAGVSRVILGTKILEQEGLIEKNNILNAILTQFGGDKVAVSLDCLDGFVTQRGWTETSPVKGLDLAKRLEGMGVKTIIYTDITRDGTLQGPNFDGVMGMLSGVNINVISSGGISSLADVEQLKNMKSVYGRVLWGAITGKAIYEGKLDFKKALCVIASDPLAGEAGAKQF